MKALIKIILLIRWYSLIYVLVKEEHLACKGCSPRQRHWDRTRGAWALGAEKNGHGEVGLTCGSGRSHIPVWRGEAVRICDSDVIHFFPKQGSGMWRETIAWGEGAATRQIIWKITGWAKYIFIYISVYIYTYICIYTYVFIAIQGQINKQCKAVELHWHQMTQISFAQRPVPGTERVRNGRWAIDQWLRLGSLPASKSSMTKHSRAAQRVCDNTANRINLVPT